MIPFPIPRRRLLVVAVSLLAAVSAPAAAQSAPSVDDPITRTLFEPELIMKHRRAINLTDEQRDAISRLIKELQDQVESLASELARPRVDLDRARDRLERVMQTERKIKEGHLTLLVRIKNLLSPQQQATLSKLRTEPSAKEGVEE